MKSLSVSNEQLLRLFILLNKLSTNAVIKKISPTVTQYCQRKKIELKAQFRQILNRNISKRNRGNISNASAVTAPVVNSTLTLDPQRTKNSLEYLISVNQTFIAYRDTHLKESTLLFILYMQSRRMQMHLFPSVSYCLYSPLANMNYFILDDSKHMEMRKEPQYFEPNQFTCVICHNICISPYVSENCIHVFCKACIEQWNQKSCPTCRTVCKEWKPSLLAEHLFYSCVYNVLLNVVGKVLLVSIIQVTN
eukprot:jgi/Galph1/1462/GphlegSOOS_G146.1